MLDLFFCSHNWEFLIPVFDHGVLPQVEYVERGVGGVRVEVDAWRAPERPEIRQVEFPTLFLKKIPVLFFLKKKPVDSDETSVFARAIKDLCGKDKNRLKFKYIGFFNCIWDPTCSLWFLESAIIMNPLSSTAIPAGSLKHPASLPLPPNVFTRFLAMFMM